MGDLIRIRIKKRGRTFQPSQHTLDLLAAPVEQVGQGVFLLGGYSSEETPDSIPESLSDLERQALRDKHGSDEPNWARAVKVRDMMKAGKACWQIVHALRHTPGMGERMVKADHAALAPLLHRQESGKK